MRVLGLDVGEKRIGVARADSDTRIAVPVGYINADGSEWLEIAKIARLQSAECFVIGLPRSNEGKETQQSAYVRSFAKSLIEKIPGAKIRFQDESLTSVMAEERLKKRKKQYEKGEIDAEAAAIILQDFLEGLKVAKTGVKSTGASESPSSNRGITSSNKIKKDTEATAGMMVGVATGVATNAKTEAEKIKLTSKKAKHKMKGITKGISILAILLVVGLIGVGGMLVYKEKVRAEREAEYQRLEAEMVAEVFTFTIRPGETIFEVKTSLLDVGYSETEIDEALNSDYDFAFLQGRPEGATLEGYLYGETYEFYKSDSAKTVISRYLSGMEQVITENNLEQRYAEKDLTLYEGITLASVVQKEAASPDQPTVAQVFLSRLSLGIPLGSDVTVSYALDKIDPERETYTDNQAALSVDSCYNTRLYGGLPCGPIANPGLSALLAVAEPTDTSYLYFLTGDDGMMYYSNTEAEHVQNIYSHCQDLCNVAL